MSLLTVILALVVLGVVMWLINTQIPMSAGIKKILNITVICVVVVWLLKIAGLWAELGRIHL